MVKISIEVRSGAARFDVAVRAENTQRAVSLVQDRYSRGSLKVRFPIGPESFFVKDPKSRREIVGVELPIRAVA
jgi:hypothetical protein